MNILSEPAAAATEPTPTVVAQRSEAYDLHLKVNVLPARDILGTVLLGCQPRQGAQRIKKDSVELPEDTRHALGLANRQLIDWLAKSQANAQAFLADPLAALGQAGVKLDRSHLKAIDRVMREVGQSQAVWPGLQMQSVQVSARSQGTVPAVEGSPPPADCGCGGKSAAAAAPANTNHLRG
jgi:hypothetical protein